MELISPLALLFGLAALVPVVLHLYQRRKRVVVLFSTNRFFTAAIHRAQRRLQLRRLLLLLLRVGMCLLLAFAFARPMLNLGRLDAVRQGHRDLLVLLDDSLSMQTADAVSQGGGRTSRWTQAKQAAAEALAQLAPGDRAAVLTFTGRALGGPAAAGPKLSTEIARLGDELQQLAPTFAAGDAHNALSRAGEALRNSDERIRLLLVISDFQAADWRRCQWPQPCYAAAAALVQVGPPARRNLLIQSAGVSQGLPVVHQPALLGVQVRNDQAGTVSTELRLLVDGKEADRRALAVAGESTEQETFPLSFAAPGEHRIAAELRVADDLPADNTWYGVLRVEPRVGVLLLDGWGDGGRDQSAAFFLQTVLAAANKGPYGIQSQVIGPDALARQRLEDYGCVILSDVGRLPEAQVARLEKFVSTGGGLAVFPGARLDRAFYNEVLGRRTGALGSLLPASIGPLIARKDRRDLDFDQAKHILDADVQHPILQRFEGPLRSALAGVSIYRTYALLPRDASVLATMEDRLPLIVEHSYGRGKVLLFSTAPQPDWCNVYQRRFFVPLIGRTVGYLAGGPGALAGNVGETLALGSGKWDELRPPQVARPDQSRVAASVRSLDGEGVASLSAAEVDQPGFYTLLDPGGERTTGEVFAVNAPRRESLPEALDLDHVQQQTGKWGLQAVSRADDKSHPAAEAIADLLDHGRAQRSVRDALLWLVLALLVIEPLVANRFVRSSPEAEAPPATNAARQRSAA